MIRRSLASVMISGIEPPCALSAIKMRLIERPLFKASRTALRPSKISSLISTFLGLICFVSFIFFFGRGLTTNLFFLSFLGLFFVGRMIISFFINIL